ncbi:hypothetical protein [Mesorhizobium sp. B2-6-1]|uniref:hypothetical protein n=1 Tax=Mesorhizobium sp. B2-6-1 TaxID=2589916 RepID=UPI001129116C|nr:hypothetical protein [Mesorhizobium sp. B2-6-1]TPJ58112.1 hypothetical protein FJ443_27750 [Mesorhizobium sp. B2-6-1]
MGRTAVKTASAGYASGVLNWAISPGWSYLAAFAVLSAPARLASGFSPDPLVPPDRPASDGPTFVRNRQNGEMKEATEALSEIVKRMCLIMINLQKRALLIPWRWIVFPEKIAYISINSFHPLNEMGLCVYVPII